MITASEIKTVRFYNPEDERLY